MSWFNQPPVQSIAEFQQLATAASGIAASDDVVASVDAAWNCMNSDDPAVVANGTEQMRALLASADAPIVYTVGKDNGAIVTKLTQFLQSSDRGIFMNALWSLSNLCSGADEEAEVVIQGGCIPILLQELKEANQARANDDAKYHEKYLGVRPQICWLIGNVSGSKVSSHKKLLVDAGTVEVMAATMDDFLQFALTDESYSCRQENINARQAVKNPTLSKHETHTAKEHKFTRDVNEGLGVCSWALSNFARRPQESWCQAKNPVILRALASVFKLHTVVDCHAMVSIYYPIFVDAAFGVTSLIKDDPFDDAMTEFSGNNSQEEEGSMMASTRHQLIQLDVLKHVVACIREGTEKKSALGGNAVKSALTVCADMLSGSHVAANAVLNEGFLECVAACWDRFPNRVCKQHVIFSLSNIACGTAEQKNLLLQPNVLDMFMKSFREDLTPTEKEDLGEAYSIPHSEVTDGLKKLFNEISWVLMNVQDVVVGDNGSADAMYTRVDKFCKKGVLPAILSAVKRWPLIGLGHATRMLKWVNTAIQIGADRCMRGEFPKNIYFLMWKACGGVSFMETVHQALDVAPDDEAVRTILEPVVPDWDFKCRETWLGMMEFEYNVLGDYEGLEKSEVWNFYGLRQDPHAAAPILSDVSSISSTNNKQM